MKHRLVAGSASTAELKKEWSTLTDVGRARAVHAIHQAGTRDQSRSGTYS